MFSFDIPQLQKLMKDMKDAGELPDDVQKKMVDEEAKVTEEALVYNAYTMLHGDYFEGAVARSVTRDRPRINKFGPIVMIKFKGYQHGNRLGEIAFVNEYGKKSQKPRRFIDTSLKESRIPGIAKAQEVLDDFLKTKKL